jgi:hypothetical protein
MATQTDSPPAGGRHTFGQWFGVLGAPVAWFVQLNLGYAWGWWACGFDRPLWPAHLTTAVCLAVALLSCGTAVASWRAVRGWPSDTDTGAPATTRTMAVLGVLTGSLFSVVIVAEWVAILMLDPCPR